MHIWSESKEKARRADGEEYRRHNCKTSPAQQDKINARAKALISEELTLRELRRARKLTQARMAKTLKVAQKQISVIEKRTDMHISTLRRAIEAMGGNLSLVATFPDREPVTLAGIADPSLEQPKCRKPIAMPDVSSLASLRKSLAIPNNFM